MNIRFLGAAVVLALAAPVLAAQPKISATLAAQAKRDAMVEVLIRPTGGADLSGLALFTSKAARGGEAMARLRASADAGQRGLRAWLDARGIEHRDYWIVNAIWARLPASDLAALARRVDVESISADSRVRQRLPQPELVANEVAKETAAIEYGVAKVRAPQMWARGHTGQGVVVAGADTGYRWDHPALKAKYRGWNGATADHAYQWHDAIHSNFSATPNPCGLSITAPCDDDGHGTHTMGTMVGDDGAGNQIGVAPGAKWIGCRNMEQGVGTPGTYIECFQFFMAPTDPSGALPDPSLAPHVVSNSWSCPPSEGCDADSSLLVKQAIEATVAAGIFVVVSAGNSGPGCGTVNEPPQYFESSFSVGATNSSDGIASFSSRGPVTIDGSGRLKPDVSAPGVSVRSSVPSGGYSSLSGTSMAAPHAAGVAALLMSAVPTLKGNVPRIAQMMRAGAVALTSTQDCSPYFGAQIPNAVFGQGRIDAESSLATVMVFSDDFE